jgi:hypothetical protein
MELIEKPKIISRPMNTKPKMAKKAVHFLVSLRLPNDSMGNSIF